MLEARQMSCIRDRRHRRAGDLACKISRNLAKVLRVGVTHYNHRGTFDLMEPLDGRRIEHLVCLLKTLKRKILLVQLTSALPIRWIDSRSVARGSVDPTAHAELECAVCVDLLDEVGRRGEQIN